MDEPTSVRASAAALGWPGTTLTPVTLFGCSFRPVVAVDAELHHERLRTEVGPQFDEDLLVIWEWPESQAPVSPVTLLGALFVVEGSWRRSLAQARRWNAFGPTALVDRTGLASADEWCRWECGFASVGLLDTSGPEPAVVVGTEDRAGPIGRVVADRWVEEFPARSASPMYPESDSTGMSASRRVLIQVRSNGSSARLRRLPRHRWASTSRIRSAWCAVAARARISFSRGAVTTRPVPGRSNKGNTLLGSVPVHWINSESHSRSYGLAMSIPRSVTRPPRVATVSDSRMRSVRSTGIRRPARR